MQFDRENPSRAKMQGIWRVPEKVMTAAANQTIRESVVIRIGLRFDNSVK